MYARPAVNGNAATLGVSGMLWRDALVMYDRSSHSLWSQVTGAAVAGPMRGRRLEELPSQTTTWGEWKRRHPDTLVLVKPLLAGSPYSDYFSDPDRIGVRGSRNPDSRLPGKELVIGLERDGRFAAIPLSLVEKQGIVRAEVLGVPLVITAEGAHEAGAGSPRVSSKIVYWAVWARFHPDTAIVQSNSLSIR